MDDLLTFVTSFVNGFSTLRAWLFTTVELGELGSFTVLSLTLGGGLVALLGYKLLRFIL